MDNKSLFDWTARMKLSNAQYLTLTVECPPNVEVVSAKLFKVKCSQCSSESTTMTQDASKVWTAENIVPLFNETSLDNFLLEADVYIEHSLESMLNMSETVATLLENGKYTDLILSVKNQKFKCHKAMLMEKSPVFEAMVRIY
jgi:hypothetical protein